MRTAEQKYQENLAFLNEPCRFKQYINEDGTVGKVYHLECGATVKINDASFIPAFEEMERKLQIENQEFHDKLLSMGAKAYRVNDGWVDRKNCKVTFFDDEKIYGYYWSSRNLQKGDLIFIGTKSDGGRFATIIEKVNEWKGSVSYIYSPTDKVIDGKYSLYKTKNNLTNKDKWKMFFGIEVELKTDIYNEER